MSTVLFKINEEKMNNAIAKWKKKNEHSKMYVVNDIITQYLF